MDKFLIDNYPERQIHHSKNTPDWLIIILILAVISLTTILFLVWRETQYLNFMKSTLKAVSEPIKISTPGIPITYIERPRQKKIQPIKRNQIAPPTKTPTQPTEKIYSWKDKNGVMQFSNVQPSEKTTNFKTINQDY